MEKIQLSLKTNKRVSVRKDLFGAHDGDRADSFSEPPPTVQDSQGVLDSIWGESDSFTFTQPTSNSLLLSPALKRTPNRFSTSPSPKKSPGTPKKSPRKLSKYSPFRKKVINPHPKDSIKKFFTVKERNPDQIEHKQESINTMGIKRLCENGASTSNTSTNSQMDDAVSINSQVDLQNTPSKNTTPMKISGSVQKSTPNTTPTSSNRSTPSKNLSPMSKITGSKDMYASFMTRLLVNAMLFDSDCDGGKIFSEDDHKYIDAFNKLDLPSQRLYPRLLNRKINWIRTSSMNYGDVTLQLMLLEQQGFITSDCSNECLETLLNLLTAPELKELCKSYKLPATGVKAEVVARLLSRAKQKSIASFFKQAPSSSTETQLRSMIYERLGTVIKVASSPYKTFSRCLLYFSYPHYQGLERDRFSDQLALVSQLRNLTFPSYQVNRTKVFHTRSHFLMYEDALQECSALLEARENKDWDLALLKLREILPKLHQYLGSEEIMAEVEAMPDFLRKFTAGGCYVRAVGSSVDILKKWDHTLAEAEACLELLLGQRLFSRHRRGQWFEQLALLYQHNMKDNVKATQAVLRGLRDEYIDLISRHTLCARAAMLEGRKKNGIKDYLKDALATQRGLVEALDEPPSVTITEQVLNSGRAGLKQVYVQDHEDGKMLSSVEEVAREHFRREGYTKGGHDEGSTIKSVIFVCFWDEIYLESQVDGHGLFHSEYQTAPLDWNSETFYLRRREKIKNKLQDLSEGGIDAVILAFQMSHARNFNTESMVNWDCLLIYEDIECLIRSIGIDVFLKLSRLLLRDHRTYRAGFPDLTLWDPEENKVVFVEVKSPNDSLSMKQRVWLHSLTRMGAMALVCHVHSVGCRSRKRIASPPP